MDSRWIQFVVGKECASAYPLTMDSVRVIFEKAVIAGVSGGKSYFK